MLNNPIMVHIAGKNMTEFSVNTKLIRFNSSIKIINNVYGFV